MPTNDNFGVEESLRQLRRAIREAKPLRPIPSPASEQETLMDADIMASIIASAFHAQGYKTRLKVVRDPGVETFHHVFVEVLDPVTKTWIPVDPQRVEPREWGEEKVVDI